jgi:hypothetical protein
MGVSCCLNTTSYSMDKVTHSYKNITPLGGLNFILKAIADKGLYQYLGDQLGARSINAKYSYSDIVLSLFANAVSQGSYISDMAHLKEIYKEQFFQNIPSPDTVEYACQELKTPMIIENTDKGVVHWFNYSDKMNALLIGLAVKSGVLRSSTQGYTLDFDNVVIENDKQDAKLSYKMTKGYHPGLAFIGRIPVHIENHNGNTPATYKQDETLQRCFDNLKKEGVKVTSFRGDAASYQKKVIEVAEANTETFYVRLVNCENFREECGGQKKWENVLINNILKEVATIEYQPFGEEKQYRAVVTRTERKDKQADLISGTAYDYYGIMTNDNVKTNKAVIEFYNQRGDDENSNRYMLNDFNLHHLPFPDMCTNTVFMYLMAICATLFEWTKTILVANKATGIKISMRVKNIFFHYILVAATYIKHARKKIFKIFSTDRVYSVLKI